LQQFRDFWGIFISPDRLRRIRTTGFVISRNISFVKIETWSVDVASSTGVMGVDLFSVFK